MAPVAAGGATPVADGGPDVPVPVPIIVIAPIVPVADDMQCRHCQLNEEKGKRVQTRTSTCKGLYGACKPDSCNLTMQTVECEMPVCDRDCILAEKVYGACSVTCGTGKKPWTRAISSPARGSGTCGDTSGEEVCVMAPCPASCKYTLYNPEGECPKPCTEPGATPPSLKWVRTAGVQSDECKDLEKTEPCNTHPCPVDCVLSEWIKDATCSAECGKGTLKLTRKVLVPAANGGAACGPLESSEECSADAACTPVCDYEPWRDEGPCSVECGKGVQKQVRTVTCPACSATELTTVCDPSERENVCNDFDCDVKCELSDWSAYDECSQACGGGIQKRTRTIVTPPIGNVAPCDGLIETRDCNVDIKCQVDCKYGAWKPKKECGCNVTSVEYERSYQATPDIEEECANGAIETRPCVDTKCPVDCVLGPKIYKDDCPSCGPANTTREWERRIQTPADGTGKSCAAEDMAGMEVCEEIEACVPTCRHAAPEESACKPLVTDVFGSDGRIISCGAGKVTVTQKSLTTDYPECTDLVSEKDCNLAPCPVDCEFTEETSDCNVKCGTGKKTITRTITKPASSGGKECPPRSESIACATNIPCSTDCSYSAWAEGPCVGVCGNPGTQAKSRTLEKGPVDQCDGPFEDVVACQMDECDSDCVMSPDAPVVVEPCPACANGPATRAIRKTILKPATGKGTACPPTDSTEPCYGLKACDKVCTYGQWTPVGKCSRECGGGQQKMERPIVSCTGCKDDIDKVATCTDTTKEEKCNDQGCAVDCKLSEWGAPGQCSMACGKGVATLKRTIVTSPSNGGLECDITTKTQECELKPCDASCVYGDWLEAPGAKCSAECGGGKIRKTRTLHTKGAGAELKLEVGPTPTCPAALSMEDDCNTHKCDRDCAQGPWSPLTGDAQCRGGCGDATFVQQRSIITPASGTGKACGPSSQTVPCVGLPPCKSQCTYTEYLNVGVCRPDKAGAKCGSGKITQKRTAQCANCKTAADQETECGNLDREVPCDLGSCPVDCVVEWGEYGECSQPCGNDAVKTKTARIKTAQANGGAPCGPTTETAPCTGLPACPSQCDKLGPFSLATPCSKDCGNEGIEVWRRVWTGDPPADANSCGALEEKRPCNRKVCTSECELSAWVDGPCSKDCKGGTMTQTRTILKAPTGDAKCDALTRSVDCNAEKPCSAQCTFGPWVEGACSMQCNQGTREVTRTLECPNCLTQDPVKECGELVKKVETCTWLPECSADQCIVGEWTDFGACSVSCGPGEQTRSRTVVKQGAGCPPLTESRPCNSGACQENGCSAGDWVPVGDCTGPCGASTRKQTRTITATPPRTVEDCGMKTEESSPCTDNPTCDVDCVLSPTWEDAGSCSAKCGTGTKPQKKTIATAALGKGKPCNPAEMSQEVPCTAAQPCDSGCQMGEWKTDVVCPPCSDTPAERIDTRWITCTSCGGDPAVLLERCGDITKKVPCVVEPCKQDCVFTTQRIDTEDPCTSTAKCVAPGEKVTYRAKYVISKMASGAGTPCPIATETVLTCDSHAAPVCSTDCATSAWEDSGTCSVECGGGTINRRRTVTPANGATCTNVPTTDVAPCNTAPCNKDCTYTEWVDAGTCSEPCGPGKKQQTRTIKTPSSGNGVPCGPLTQSIDCELGPCALKCTYGDWVPQGTCSQPCNGVRRETRTSSCSNCDMALVASLCPDTAREAPCSTPQCGVADCVLSEWSAFGDCSSPCGPGVQKRTRSITTPASGGGAPCGTLMEEQPCTTPCPPGCEYSAPTAKSPCSVECGGGKVTMTSTLIKGTVAECGPQTSEVTQDCNMQQCAVNCETGAWEATTECTNQCGGGTREESLKIIKQAVGSGAPCPAVRTRQSPCNTNPCAGPPQCITGSWTVSAECSADACGDKVGTRTLSTTISCPACKSDQERDNMCGPNTKTEPCPPRPCGQDCVQAAGEWGKCSITCRIGDQLGQRVRTNKLTQPQYGGAACTMPPLETEQCGSELPACDPGCSVSPWVSAGGCDKTCGGGYEVFTRTVSYKGSAPIPPGQTLESFCGATTDQRPCNVQPCDDDCVTTSPVLQGACADGQETWVRSILKAQVGSGKPCPPLMEKRACSTTTKSNDPKCDVGAWAVITPCTATCTAPGIEVSQRTVSCAGCADPETVCGPRMQQAPCPAKVCNQDCVTSSWSEWSTCSACGNAAGQQTRSRSIISQPTGGGAACQTVESRECRGSPCPEGCTFTEWAAQGACRPASGQCGPGTQINTRIVTPGPGVNAATCGPSSNNVPCEVPCTADCVMSPWVDAGPCSSTCGAGVITQTRSVAKEAQGSGQPCGDTSRTTPCTGDKCEKCEYGAFTLTQECPVGGCVKVGQAQIFRTESRTVKCATCTSDDERVRVCGDGKKLTPCELPLCAIDCEEAPVQEADWSACSSQCGEGTRTRTIRFKQREANGGKPCGRSTESQPCKTTPGPQSTCGDCVYGPWQPQGPCSKNCGGGTQTLIRTVTPPAGGDMSWCDSPTKQGPCNEQSCDQDCVMGIPGAWGECSKQCDGTQTQVTPIVKEPTGRGRACPPTTATRPCSPGGLSCSDPGCQLGPWETGTCNAVCPQRTGVKAMTRTVTCTNCRDALAVCGPREKHDPCEIECAKDCAMGTWSPWTACTSVCYTEGEPYPTESRTRSILSPPSGGGKACETELLQERRCAAQLPLCDACQFSVWANSGQCDKPCGGGRQQQQRRVLSGGKNCGPLTQMTDCNPQPCDVTCEYSSWEIGTCQTRRPDGRACGNDGSAVSTRRVLAGGTKCTDTSQTRACTFPVSCSPTCTYGQDVVEKCTATCDGATSATAHGQQVTTRTVTCARAEGGSCTADEARSCKPDRESKACTTQCAVQCEMSDWQIGACGTCIGPNEQVRVDTRRRLRGDCTGQLVVMDAIGCTPEQEAGLKPCPTDCVVSDWMIDSRSPSQCDAKCDGGVQHVVRTVTATGSADCSLYATKKVQACNVFGCKADCMFSEWSNEGTCVTKDNCGSGAQRQTRRSLSASEECNTAALLARSVTCDAGPCVVKGECVWDPPQLQAPCSARSCGHKGEEVYIQYVAKGSSLEACGTPTLLTRKPCDGPCGCEGQWSEWTCSATCYDVNKAPPVRRREKILLNKDPTVACTDTIQEDANWCAVNLPKCASQPTCAYSDWIGASFSQELCPNWCTAPTGPHAGQSVYIRTRTMTGTCTDTQSLIQSTWCLPRNPPAGCTCDGWMSDGECSAPCGGGTQTWVRSVSGGTQCGPAQVKVECNTQSCASTVDTDCVVGEWTYGECTPEGYRVGNGRIVTPRSGRGAACPPTEVVQKCDYVWKEHQGDLNCDATCDAVEGACHCTRAGDFRKLVTYYAKVTGNQAHTDMCKQCTRSLECAKSGEEICLADDRYDTEEGGSVSLDGECRLGGWTTEICPTESCHASVVARRRVLAGLRDCIAKKELVLQTVACPNHERCSECEFGAWTGAQARCTGACQAHDAPSINGDIGYTILTRSANGKDVNWCLRSTSRRIMCNAIACGEVKVDTSPLAARPPSSSDMNIPSPGIVPVALTNITGAKSDGSSMWWLLLLLLLLLLCCLCCCLAALAIFLAKRRKKSDDKIRHETILDWRQASTNKESLADLGKAVDDDDDDDGL